MRKYIQTFVVCGLVAGMASAARADGMPRIKFDRTVYDFGTTSLVSVVSGVFAFENTGDGELEIKSVVAGCGCTATAVKPASKKLAPGEKGAIAFDLKLGMSHGRMLKHIAVTTNDPQTPTVNLDLDVTVEAVLQAPAQISIGEMSLRSETNFVVEVRRVDGQPFQLSEVRSTGALVTAQLDEASRGTGTVARVLVNVKGGGTVRQMIGNLHFMLPGVETPAAATMVIGKMVGDLQVTPQRVYWGIGDPSKWPGTHPEVTTKRVVRLTTIRPDVKFELGKVTSSLSNVTATVVTEEKGSAYQVTLRLVSLTGDAQQGEVSIETNMTDYPKVTVPVYVFTGQKSSDSLMLKPR